MTSLNRELLKKLKELTAQNKELLTTFLVDLTKAQTDSEKRDAVAKLNSKIREIVVKEEVK